MGKGWRFQTQVGGSDPDFLAKNSCPIQHVNGKSPFLIGKYIFKRAHVQIAMLAY